MAFLQTDKLFSRAWFRTWALITAGSFILATGFVFFISPHRIIPGGVYGIAIVIHYVSKGAISFWPEGIPIGMLGLIMNIPLTIIGIRILGPRFGVKTIVGFILTSVFMDLLTYNPWFGQGDKALVDDVLLSCIFGGALVGFGLGLIFRSKATSGGSDIVAMILAKYTRMPLGMLMIYVDSVIVLIGLVVFADWKIPLYSWLVIFITGKVIDAVIQGISYEKMLLIISDKSQEIRDKIIHDLNRGGTYFQGKGMYNDQEKRIIYTVVNRRELVMLKDFIRNIDPGAFVSVVDASEILGNGFRRIGDDAI